MVSSNRVPELTGYKEMWWKIEWKRGKLVGWFILANTEAQSKEFIELYGPVIFVSSDDVGQPWCHPERTFFFSSRLNPLAFEWPFVKQKRYIACYCNILKYFPK